MKWPIFCRNKDVILLHPLIISRFFIFVWNLSSLFFTGLSGSADHSLWWLNTGTLLIYNLTGSSEKSDAGEILITHIFVVQLHKVLWSFYILDMDGEKFWVLSPTWKTDFIFPRTTTRWKWTWEAVTIGAAHVSATGEVWLPSPWLTRRAATSSNL